MATSQQKLMSVLSLIMAAAMLSGCSQSTAAGAGRHATTAAAKVGVEATTDVRACAGVQAIIGHVSADVERWSPNLNPFDKAISARIHELSQDLAKQEPQAQTTRVRAAIRSNTHAFQAVSDAMSAKNRDKVTNAIQGTRVAYRGLKKACSLT